MHWTIHDLWGRWNCSGNKEGIVKQLEDEPYWVHEGLPVPFEVRKGPTVLLWVLSLHFDLIKSDLQKSTTNQFDCRCHFWFFKPSAFSCKLLGKNGNSKRLKNFMHDLDNIWWTSISNYRWLSTKIRIAGPKYCKDTTYVGEMGFMIVSNWLYWLCHLQGVCFMAVDSYPKMK